MAKTISFGYAAAASTVNVARPALDIDDYAVISDDASQECLMTNLDAPTDQPEIFRWAHRPIANMYANSDIEPSYRSTTKTGTSIIVEAREVGTVTDSSDPTYRVDIPLRIYTVMELSNDASLTDNAILEVVKRHQSQLYNDATSTSSRIKELRHNAMKPSTFGTYS